MAIKARRAHFANFKLMSVGRMELTMDTVIRQSDNQSHAYIDGEVAMMSIDKGNYYMLNEVGLAGEKDKYPEELSGGM